MRKISPEKVALAEAIAERRAARLALRKRAVLQKIEQRRFMGSCALKNECAIVLQVKEKRHRASGLTLATAAIAIWNTVYLERAVNSLREKGHPVDPALQKHLSPLGWEHINLTGDY